MALVTIQEARDHIRIDSAADDSWLEIWIPIVEQSVFDWLKDEWRLYVPSGLVDSQGDPIPLEDSNGPVVSPRVRGAVLVELAWQYRFRDGDADLVSTSDLSSGRYGYILSRGATALLHKVRKSTIV